MLRPGRTLVPALRRYRTALREWFASSWEPAWHWSRAQRRPRSRATTGSIQFGHAPFGLSNRSTAVDHDPTQGARRSCYLSATPSGRGLPTRAGTIGAQTSSCTIVILKPRLWQNQPCTKWA